MQPDAQANLVSVVLPTLNGSRYVAEAIRSVLAQTYRNLELIVVDGGSTDGTLDIVASLHEARLRVIRQASNHDRLPGALNEGFAQAQGAYFTWAQDDDLYAPQALEAMVGALQAHSEVGLVYADFDFVDEAGRWLRSAQLGPPEDLVRTNVVGHCFLYRREVAEKAGQYDPAFLMSEDSHFWLRVYRQSRLLHLRGCHYYHRLHGGSLTGRDFGAYQSLRAATQARREVLGISWWEYNRQLAAAYIEEAFAAHAARDRRRVRRCLAQGLLRNPVWLRNRGVLSLAWQSLVGFRRRPPRRELDRPA